MSVILIGCSSKSGRGGRLVAEAFICDAEIVPIRIFFRLIPGGIAQPAYGLLIMICHQGLVASLAFFVTRRSRHVDQRASESSCPETECKNRRDADGDASTVFRQSYGAACENAESAAN